MKFTFLLLALAAASPASAEWTHQGSTSDVNFYIDLSTIKKSAEVRRVWQLQNRNIPSKSGTRSLRALSEYDCKEGKYRIIQIDTFSEAMAQGTPLSTDPTPGQWHFIAPGTPFADSLKLVCLE